MDFTHNINNSDRDNGQDSKNRSGDAGMKFNHYLGAAVAAWLLAIMVVVAELFAPFKDFLIATFSHHWIGKAVIVALAFVIGGFLLGGKNPISKYSSEDVAWYSTLGGLAAILAFYVFEFIT